MIEFNFTIGIMLLLLNSSIILSLIFGVVYRLKSQQRIKRLRDFDMNFLVLFASAVFLFASCFAFYTGYKYYIINGGISDKDIIVARFVDRTAMLVVSVLFILMGRNISKNITENEDK